MNQDDALNVLGLKKPFSKEELKAAYIAVRYFIFLATSNDKKAKIYHPDVNPSRSAPENFSKVREAHKVIPRMSLP